MFQYTGEYTKHRSERKNGIDYYTFTPAPLLNGVSIVMDEELFALLTTTHRLLGILEGMAMFLPDGDTIKELMILKESCYSRLIDKKDSPTFYDALKSLSTKRDDMSCVANIVIAQKYSYGKPVGSLELSKIHNIIINGPSVTEQSKVREEQTFLNNVVTNLKIYSPTAPEHILPAIRDLAKFLKRSDGIDALIKAALAHYQFEVIHPYECCNGLVGRILIQMILFNAEYKAPPFLCPSEYLYHNKDEYFDKLSSTQMGNGYLYWIKFFVRAICSAASHAVEQIKRFEEVVTRDTQEIISASPSTKSAMMVYNYFKNQLVSEIKPAAEELKISFNTVAKSIDNLLELGILEIENTQSRHRRFIYKRIIEMFDKKC